MLDVSYKGRHYRITSRLIGFFNVYNILASFATCVALGIHTDAVITGIERLHSIKGRMEPVADNVFVDFAHTPSAIEFALKSLRRYTQGRLIIVFGCGGDRDREKRPRMGACASELADLVVITSDNSRSESPQAIIKDITQGITKSNYTIIEDRREAIHHALSLMTNDDILVVAGKGHEEYQIQGTVSIPFSDAEVIHEWYACS
jgi:UDP-N-acetylmuramoyl-L-alanyl-D-glutamate--2,6-diaminopimelate ligase